MYLTKEADKGLVKGTLDKYPDLRKTEEERKNAGLTHMRQCVKKPNRKRLNRQIFIVQTAAFEGEKNEKQTSRKSTKIWKN